MRTAALIDENGIAGRAGYQKLKEEIRADALIVVTGADFCQDGRPAAKEKYDRARRLREQGADLVLELPVYCALTTSDTFAFAAVSLLEKLNCVDELVLLYRGAEEENIRSLVQFLFIESADYQAAVKRRLAEGMEFSEAQALVTERYIPGAKKILECGMNRLTVEYARAMKRLYSTMKARFYRWEGGDAPRPEPDPRADRFLGRRFRELLDAMPAARRVRYLNEIAGGYAPDTEKLLAAYRQPENVDFASFAEALVTPERYAKDARRYLLRAILGIRQVDISICGLYSYALYARALGAYENSAIFEQVRKCAWLPVFASGRTGGQGCAQTPEMADDSVKILTEIDRRAEELYREGNLDDRSASQTS